MARAATKRAALTEAGSRDLTLYCGSYTGTAVQVGTTGGILIPCSTGPPHDGTRQQDQVAWSEGAPHIVIRQRQFVGTARGAGRLQTHWHGGDWPISRTKIIIFFAPRKCRTIFAPASKTILPTRASREPATDGPRARSRHHPLADPGRVGSTWDPDGPSHPSIPYGIHGASSTRGSQQALAGGQGSPRRACSSRHSPRHSHPHYRSVGPIWSAAPICRVVRYHRAGAPQGPTLSGVVRPVVPVRSSSKFTDYPSHPNKSPPSIEKSQHGQPRSALWPRSVTAPRLRVAAVEGRPATTAPPTPPPRGGRPGAYASSATPAARKAAAAAPARRHPRRTPPQHAKPAPRGTRARRGGWKAAAGASAVVRTAGRFRMVSQTRRQGASPRRLGQVDDD